MWTVWTANALAVRTTAADVGVAAEVLDGDVERVPALVDVGDDRLARPVPVCVDDVARVTVAQQGRVVPRIGRQRPHPGPDARPLTPFGGTRPRHAFVHSAACVPTTDTLAYSRAAFISPCVHSDALTETASSEASGSTSRDAP